MNGYGLGGKGSIPGWGKIFLTTPHYSMASRLALQSTQPPIQWVLRALSMAVKRQGHEVDHSSTCSSEVKNGEAIPPFPLISLMAWCLINQKDNLIHNTGKGILHTVVH
jgi:hypothetical protein